ncbi:MAG: hypothetical protein C5B47_05835 [Verrucomicrobia bacterium]|nr:MAG: hypothetical protein C5B47_05835 [Verrucomicrobiota bacterium]
MNNSQRGFALILVLWSTLILSFCILAAAWLANVGISHSRLSSRRFEAKQLALTGIAYGCDPRIEIFDPLLTQQLGSRRQLNVIIRSEGGRVNINHLLACEDYTTLADLFKQWGINEQDAAALTDCLKDWIDSDDLSSLHGAERSDLEGTPFSMPENRPFLTVAEMAGIKDWELVEQLKPDWADSFSILSTQHLDFDEVSAEILMAFGRLTQHQAESLVTYRNGLDRKPKTQDDVKIESTEQLEVVVGGLSGDQKQAIEQRFQFQNADNPIRIVSTGMVAGTKYAITAIVVGRGKEYLWWEEK